MAMPFSGENGAVVRKAYERFKVGVAEAGFHLSNPLLDMPKAGLIDDHLQLEIRLAHFLIVDLTGNNCGAYWEAGFAAGMDKKVIYTCEKSFFEEKGTHFDTGHHQTVLWTENTLDEDTEKLKAIIRNTFPVEAKMPEDE